MGLNENSGLSKIELKQYEAAIKDFEKAREMGSTNPGTWNGIGMAWKHLGNYEKALYYLNLAIKLKPGNEEFLLQRAYLFMELKNYESTIQDLSAALKLKPKDPFILYQRGLCFYEEANYPKALTNLSKSLRFDANVSYIADVYYH